MYAIYIILSLYVPQKNLEIPLLKNAHTFSCLLNEMYLPTENYVTWFHYSLFNKQHALYISSVLILLHLCEILCMF